MSASENDRLLSQARRGDREALGKLLSEQCQALEQMTRREVEGRLKARLSAADIVQQTCLSAIRSFEDFQGHNERQFAAWLKCVHDRNVKDVLRRHVQARKRAITDQQPLDEVTPPEDSSSTPSQRVIKKESADRLIESLSTLPESQAEAVRLRHLQQLSLSQIAAQMNCTEVAVASLLKRGLVSLRDRLPDNSK